MAKPLTFGELVERVCAQEEDARAIADRAKVLQDRAIALADHVKAAAKREAESALDPEVFERMCRGKKAYRSANAAGAAAQTVGERHGVERFRVYRCPVCQEFHLTTKSLERFAEVG